MSKSKKNEKNPKTFSPKSSSNHQKHPPRPPKKSSPFLESSSFTSKPTKKEEKTKIKAFISEPQIESPFPETNIEKGEEDEYSGLKILQNSSKANGSSKQSCGRFPNKKPFEIREYKRKWKTEMCHYWEMNGVCKYGNNCAFAHGSQELNKRKMSLNYKTKMCKQFFELGYCSYGVRCQFSHKKIKEENDEDNEKVSYCKVLDCFNNFNEEDSINQEIIKRPRLMTFENLVGGSKKETEENRIQLYEDIIEIKKKEKEIMRDKIKIKMFSKKEKSIEERKDESDFIHNKIFLEEENLFKEDLFFSEEVTNDLSENDISKNAEDSKENEVKKESNKKRCRFMSA